MTEFLCALVRQVLTKGTKLYFDTWNARKMEQHLSAHYGEDYAKEKAEKEAARQEWEDLASGFGGLLLGGFCMGGNVCGFSCERLTWMNTSCRQMYSRTHHAFTQPLPRGEGPRRRCHTSRICTPRVQAPMARLSSSLLLGTARAWSRAQTHRRRTARQKSRPDDDGVVLGATRDLDERLARAWSCRAPPLGARPKHFIYQLLYEINAEALDSCN